MTWNTDSPLRSLPDIQGPDSPGAQAFVGTSGANAYWMNGGNSLVAPGTLGTLTAQPLSLFAGLSGLTKQVFATFDAVNAAIFGADPAVIAGAKTILQAGTGALVLKTGTANPAVSPSSIVVAVDPTSNGSVQVAAQGTGAISLSAGSGLSQWLTTPGGQLHFGSNGGVFTNTADSVQLIASSIFKSIGGTGWSATASTGNLTCAATAGQNNRTAGTSITDTPTTTYACNAGTGWSCTATTGNATISATAGAVEIAGSTSIGPALAAPDASAGFDLSTIIAKGASMPQVPDATLLALANPLAGLYGFGTTSKVVRVNVGTPGSPNWRKAAGGSMFSATGANAQSFTDNAAAATITTWVAQAGTNQDAAFVAATGVFTAPIAGYYRFSVTAELAAAAANLGASWTVGIAVNGTVLRKGKLLNPVAALNQTRQAQVTAAVQLAAGDVVTFTGALAGAGGNIALSADATTTFVSGELVS